MATTYEGNQFLKLDKIKGDSEAEGFKQQIRVRGFSVTASNGGSKSSSGNATLSPISLSLIGNSALGAFWLAFQNQVVMKGELTVTQVDGQSSHKAVTVIGLEGVKVTDVNMSGVEGLVEMEFPVQITVTNFNPQFKSNKDDGTVGATSKVKWDVKKGKATGS
jgi:type VI secretion system secreted protein Hcp